MHSICVWSARLPQARMLAGTHASRRVSAPDARRPAEAQAARVISDCTNLLFYNLIFLQPPRCTVKLLVGLTACQQQP